MTYINKILICGLLGLITQGQPSPTGCRLFNSGQLEKNKMAKMITHKEFVSEISDRSFIAMEEYKGRHANINFKCDRCDSVWSARPSNVVAGTGCPHCKSMNQIIADHGSWIEVDVSTKSLPNSIMKIDKADYHRIKEENNGRISAKKSTNNRNVYASMRGRNGALSIHRYVKNAERAVDHINNNGLDNRQSNLRECTNAENSRNCRMSLRNSSGVKGVSWHARSGKWQAELTKDRKRIRLGYFDFLADAATARREAEKKYFRAFAFTTE